MMQSPPADVYWKYRTEIDQFVAQLNRAAQIAYWVASWLGEPLSVDVTSWYRDPATNARVGGNPRSFHLAGLGLDLVTNSPRIVMWAARYVGLQAIDEGDHVHLEPHGPSPVGG